MYIYKNISAETKQNSRSAIEKPIGINWLLERDALLPLRFHFEIEIQNENFW